MQATSSYRWAPAIVGAGGVFVVLLVVALLTKGCGAPRDTTSKAIREWANDDSGYQALAEDNDLAKWYATVKDVGATPSEAAKSLEQAAKAMATEKGENKVKTAILERVKERAFEKTLSAVKAAMEGEASALAVAPPLREASRAVRNSLEKKAYESAAKVAESAGNAEEDRRAVARTTLANLGKALGEESISLEDANPTMAGLASEASAAVRDAKAAKAKKDSAATSKAIRRHAEAVRKAQEEFKKAKESGELEKNPTAYIAPILKMGAESAEATGVFGDMDPEDKDTLGKIVDTIDKLNDMAMAAQIYVAVAYPVASAYKCAIILVVKLITELLKGLGITGGGSSGPEKPADKGKPEGDGHGENGKGKDKEKGKDKGAGKTPGKPTVKEKGEGKTPGKSPSEATKEALKKSMPAGSSVNPSDINPSRMANDFKKRTGLTEKEAKAAENALTEAKRTMGSGKIKSPEALEQLAAAVERAVPNLQERMKKQKGQVDSLAKDLAKHLESKTAAGRRQALEARLSGVAMPDSVRAELLSLAAQSAQKDAKDAARLIAFALLYYEVKLPADFFKGGNPG